MNMNQTIVVYSIARRDADGERYYAIITGADRRVAHARLLQDGVDRDRANRMINAAGLSTNRPGARLVDGDVFEHIGEGPRGESYKLRATSLRIDPLA